jgi:hypothetical protein
VIRLFVGCAPDGHDAESQAVLEHSIRTRCSEPVDVTWMIATRDPASFWNGWDMSRWATPFSGFRWAVPMACGYSGRAIYMDSDLIVLGDLAELWRLDLSPGHVVAARDATRFCVALWDCDLARKHLPQLEALRQADGHNRASAYFRVRPQLVRSFGSAWNYLDSADRGPFGKIVHYTDLSTQPHLHHAIERLKRAGMAHWYDGPRRPHPRREIAELFHREFDAAIADGYSAARYAPAEHYGPIGKRAMRGYRPA